MGKLHLFRVHPGGELLRQIENYCEKKKLRSGIVLGIIGSLNHCELAFIKDLPGNYRTEDFGGPMEIVSAQGTIGYEESSGNQIVHIHIMISTEEWSIGGHLKDAEVFSTAEVAILETAGELDVKRYKDGFTGLFELKD